MAEKKEFRPIDPRVENIIKGLFVVLLGVVVIINIGYVGRTLAFPFIYFFGATMYPLLGFMIFTGLYRIIKKKRFQFHGFLKYVGVVLLAIALTIIITFITVKSQGMNFATIKLSELLDSFNGQLGSYYDQKTLINMFDGSNLYACGLIGILVGGLIQNDAIIIFLGVVIFLLGVLAVLYKTLLSLKGEKKSKAQRKSEKEAAKREIIERQREENNPVISTEEAHVYQDPISNHKTDISKNNYGQELEPANIEVGFESDQTPFINENSGFSQVGSSLDEIYGRKVQINEQNNEYTEFTPLVFNNEGNPFSRFQQAKPQPQPQVVEETPTIEETPIIEEEEEINLIDSRPTPEVPPVQEEKTIDESLVKMQPHFAEAVEVPNESMIQATPTPAVETPQEVKRPKIVWIPPSTDLLMVYETEEAREINEKVANERVEALNSILSDFRTGARVSGYTIGPSITRFNVEYESNVSSKNVEKYVQDISRRLGGVAARFAAVVPGESYSGFEVPNATITTVGFKDTFNALPDVKKHPLAVAFGKDISGNVIYADFDEFPHLLVAGTTGSGKSIYVHSIISTLIMRVSPDYLRIVLVDPKRVEMTKYRDMPHLLCPIITEAEKAKVCLQKLCDEMNRRYELFSQNGEVSNIKDYNKFAKETGIDPLPYIIVFIDEYADLVDSCKEISQPVVSIAQKARAAGIHLCIATQRPSTNIITGVIKGNIPTHVALMTSSYTDSIIIIGEAGAETLLGKGDMLVQSPLVSRVGVTRLQGCYIQNKEIVHVVNYLKEHYETYYDPNFLDLVDHSKEPAQPVLAPGEVEKESSQEEENKYQSIKEWVMTQEFVSMSKIQRECSVGFNRAGRFFSRLQKEGVVSTTQDGSSKGCRVLVHDDYDTGDTMVTSDELIG